jgi:hypothetical protein
MSMRPLALSRFVAYCLYIDSADRKGTNMLDTYAPGLAWTRDFISDAIGVFITLSPLSLLVAAVLAVTP